MKKIMNKENDWDRMTEAKLMWWRDPLKNHPERNSDSNETRKHSCI